MAGENKKMTRNALILMPAKVLEGVLLLATASIYSRVFPPVINGQYQLVNSTVLALFLVTAAWLYNATARFISEYRSPEGEKTFYSTFLLSFGVITLAVLAVGAGAWLISGSFLCLAASVMLTTYSLFTMMNGLLIQTDRLMVSIAASLLDVGGKLAFSCLLAALFTAETPYPAVFGAVLGDLAASLVAMAALRAPFHIHPQYFSRGLLQDLLAFGLPLIGMSVGTGLLSMVDRFIVAAMMGEANASVYISNFTVSSGIFGMIAAAVVRAVYPSLIAGYAKDGLKAAETLLSQGLRIYFLIGAPAALGLCAVCRPLAQFMFIEVYWPGASVIGIVALAYFFMDLTEYAIKGFELTKNTKPVLRYSLLAAGVKIAATVILICLLGIQGAALGSLVAFLFYFLLVVWGLRRSVRLRPDGKSCFRILTSAFLCSFSAWLVCRFLPAGPFVQTICGAGAGGVVYFVCLFVSGELKPEIEMIRQTLAAGRGAGNSSKK